MDVILALQFMHSMWTFYGDFCKVVAILVGSFAKNGALVWLVLEL